MDKIKQKTPKHEAETCWNNSNKATSLFYSYYTVLNFAILLNLRVSYISRVLNFAIFSKSRKSRNLVLAKLIENKVTSDTFVTLIRGSSKFSRFARCLLEEG